MAIEKMMLLTLIGSVNDEDKLIEEMILEEKVHLSLEHGMAYDNHYMLHKFETILETNGVIQQMDEGEMEKVYRKMEEQLLAISKGLGIDVTIDFSGLRKGYSFEEAQEDLRVLQEEVSEKLLTIQSDDKKIQELMAFKRRVEGILVGCIDLKVLNTLNHFSYQIGMLSKESQRLVKANAENITAIFLRISERKKNQEAMYLVIYPNKLEDETTRLLKSLSFETLMVPLCIRASGTDFMEQLEQEILALQIHARTLEQGICEDLEAKKKRINSIYTRLKINQEIIALKREVIHGNELFILNGWIRAVDEIAIEKHLSKIEEKIIFFTTEAEAFKGKMVAPTRLINHKLVKPFELIVRLYGLPGYDEIDPTPFLGITFMLMFGIMFGDIGQGFIYFLAGVWLRKKQIAASGILIRLGISSMIFGFIYGSLFGLEQHQLPWLPSLTGPILSQANIMPILFVGIVFGVVVLSISYVIGIINTMRKGMLEDCVFGKNGLAGYLFFLAFIVTLVSLVGLVSLNPLIPLGVMGVLLVVMILKEPLIHLVLKKKPLIEGDKGGYFTESIFEGIETILGTVSNTISFIRVGAFALNHAGLFMAFLVMSEMVDSPILKILILIAGNSLILALEGLIVFIQGLRLEYYEMFSKYFTGNGIDYMPTTIRKQ